MEIIMEIVETYLKKKMSLKMNIESIDSPSKASAIFTKMFGNNSQECLGVVCLDTKNIPTHISTIFKGSTNFITISPKDILKVALLSNATSIIIGHNHPSSDLLPSKEDIVTTHNIVKACKVIGIKLLDHLIINAYGEYYSIREHNPEEFGDS